MDQEPRGSAGDQPDAQGEIYVEDELLRAGFTQIPNQVLRHPNLSPGAKLTYVMLLSYAWHGNSCFLGQQRLAEDIGVGRRSVVRYVRELMEAGLLIVRRRGLGLTNLYILPRLGSYPGPHTEQTSQPRSAKFAHQEVQQTSHLEVQNLHPNNTQVNNTHLKKDSNIRKALQGFVEQVSAEMGDEAPLEASLSRMVNLYVDSGLQLEDFVALIDEARAITKRRSTSITKTSSRQGTPWRGKNRMPYFFGVLEDLVRKHR